MSDQSKIEWTQATWNPVTGCSHASAGCDNCYAVHMSYRLDNCGQPKYRALTHLNRHGDRHFNGTVRCHVEEIDRPKKWRLPTIIFVNSMADLFHRKVPFEFIVEVFKTMNACQQHTFQILTKRPERVASLSSQLSWSPNIWLGTSVEDEKVVGRIESLMKVPAKVRFLSIEPLIGPIGSIPSLSKIDWIIVGGESGKHARPLNVDWARAIRDACTNTGVPFFFKQWGKQSNNTDKNDPTAKHNGGSAKGGRMLDGKIWDEMPSLDTKRIPPSDSQERGQSLGDLSLPVSYG